MRKKRLLIASITLLLACAPFAYRPVFSPAETSFERVIKTLEANNNLLHNLKGQGRLIIENLGKSYSLDAHIVIIRPDTLYVRLEAIFGVNVGWLFSDRNDYTFYIPMQNAFFTGSSDSLAFGKFLDFDLKYDSLLGAMTGIDLLSDLEQYQLSQDGEMLLLQGRSQVGKHIYWIDPRHGVITRAEIRDNTNQVVLIETFERFRQLHGIFVPRTIRIQRPMEQQGFTIFYEKLSLNEKISGKEFKRKIPSSARQLVL